MFADISMTKPSAIPITELHPAQNGKTFPMIMNVLYAEWAKTNLAKNHKGKSVEIFF